MNTSFNIFLDLEETVIDNWDNGMLIRSTAVREFLMQHGAVNFTVFSFAVWNKADQATFDRNHRLVLERALDARVKACPTVEDFMQAEMKVTGIRFDTITDFVATKGKTGAFTTWCNLHHPTENCLLLDDVVDNIDIINRDSNRIIRFVNVASID